MNNSSTLQSFRKLWTYVRPYRGTFFMVIILGAAMSGLMTLATALAKDLFDKGFKPGHLHELGQICLSFIGIYLVHGCFRYFHMYFLIYTSEKITVQIQKDLQEKYMVLSYRFHNLSDSGGHISRILNDVNTVKWGLTIFADVVREPLLVIGLLSWVIYLDAKLTLGLFIIAPIIVIGLGKVGRSIRKYSYTQQETLEKFTSTLKETFDGLRVIQSFNLEGNLRQRLAKVSDEYLHARSKIISRQEFASPMTEWIAACAFAGASFYIGNQISNGTSDVGEFISYIAALGMLQQPIKKLQDAYVRIQQTVAANERIFSVLEDDRQVPEPATPRPFPREWNQITFRDVSFAYADQKILDSISLTVKRGQVIALIGESGSGKSTMMNLLERFIDPDQGEILIGDTEIRKFALSDLRHNIALVTQDVFLFNETIEDSIRSGLPMTSATSTVTVEQAARMANAIDFVEKRPLKFQTVVGERGSALSGGEKQRISIARAIYKNAPILILDEATSALDSASEVEVQKGLDKLMEGRTTFVIAHRLSTVTRADRILVMDKGQIVEEGTHAELLKREGAYHKFYQLQVPT